MNKTLLIIKREYFSRVKKKSFLIMTFLVPMLIIGMYALIFALSMSGGDNIPTVEVIDESGIFNKNFEDKKSVNFEASELSLTEAKKKVINNEDAFVLYIPKDISTGGSIEMFAQKKAGLSVISTIERQLNDQMRIKLLKDAGIDSETLDKIKPNLSVVSKELTIEGEKDSSSGAAMAVGFAAAILIYMSLFIYGIQVMRGIIEEKTSRIVEVVISSVKPFQLMMGKIIGIGLVGLTQFMLWIVLSASLMTLATTILFKDKVEQVKSEMPMSKQMETVQNDGPGMDIVKAVQTVQWTYILPVFIIFFLGGYMLYSALFAAVGSAVDSDTETQQFMLPITLPLLFTYIMSFSFIVNNPDSSLSFWLSIIPFTSPIAMMVRLPFGVPNWELALSIFLLIGGFIFTTWVASRIYRVGILMYGKKVSFKELGKWFMYRE
ncbi:ABC-2 type transport system permease protein [Daejeonella rubra]|uniref:ABC-2 type transport system permease protein n=1 Tax=Daejeonella rubra TaxID=990371 RepID=A0A1G9MWV8_9SPHI|nr:ABC transporter permease [Daejeonella rubra]SDL78762.1 ABC-2 type transport system permease protein [Daejeonella rubra]